jgi:serine/threonine protein kinase
VRVREFEGTERFQVLTRLGHGGMGTVYQVIDRVRQTRVALKSVGQVAGDELLRFKREFRALSEIDHPNIIELGELLEENGEWFFTMELISGTDFLEHVRGRALPAPPLSEALKKRAVEDTRRHRVKTPGSRLDLPIVRDLGFDEARLRSALAQLADALYAVHVQGHVHRDVKPSNVLVTSEGRVVVIDFGLVAGPRTAALSTEMHIVGTVGYMSPEQATGTSGPEADWYAMGAMLYEALTGRLPLEGTGLPLLIRKQTELPPRPRLLVPEVPEDLDALCMDLLAIDPARRPSGREVLQRLHVETMRTDRISSSTLGSRREDVVGRETELRVLEDLFEETLAGSQRIVTLIGESGVGKTAVLRCFEARIAEHQPETVVLHGRCYEQETVPFKALDSVMDQLSRWLKRLPPERVLDLMPEDVGVLGKTFPVLQRVSVVAKARRDRFEVKDPQQRRIMVMRTLRAVFDALARHSPLIIVIDDFQWSDQDSLRMLAELTSPPDPPPLMLVYSTRHDEELEEVDRGTVLRLAPLSAARSLELARSMARFLGKVTPQQLEAVAREAEGYPFLIEALLFQLGDTRFAEGTGLDERIAGTVRALDEQSRRLVEVVCLAGFPVTQQVAAEAAGLEPSELNQRLRALRLQKLLKTSGTLNTDTAEPYHDRIRVAVAADLSRERRQVVHDALARALEAHRGEPRQIAHHLRSGAEPARAVTYMVSAAERALQAHAFERAGVFYGEALSIGDLPRDQKRTLLVARGRALASAGKGRLAAEVFASAIDGANATESLDLRRRVAEQLLIAGWYHEGLAACEAFVESLGIRVPRHPKRVLIQYLWTDFVLWLRGVRHKIRERDQLSPNEISRVDAYWSMAKGIAPYDPVRAELFHARGLLLALKAGEPYRLSRALALSSLTLIIFNPAARSRADARLATARTLAQRAGHPHGLAFVDMMEGMLEYLAHCRFKRTVEIVAPAREALRQNCDDVAWELELCEQASRLCFYWMGEWKRLIDEAPELRKSDDRGHRFLQGQSRQQWMSFAAALNRDFTGARKEIDQVVDFERSSASPIERFLHLVAHLRVDLIEGTVHGALARYEMFRPGFIERLALKPTIMRTLYESLGVVVLLAAAEQRAGAGRAQLFERAERQASAMVRKGVECTAPLVALALAVVRFESGHMEAAVNQLTIAEDGFAEQSMLAHLAVAKRRRGQILGGDAGRALIAEAEAFFAHQGVHDVPAASRLLGPGFRSGD